MNALPTIPVCMPGLIDYTGDNYPRDGCTATVEVSRYGYQLSIFAPSGARMESYRSVKSPRAVARMLREWAEGKVPRLTAPEDQVSESKS